MFRAKGRLNVRFVIFEGFYDLGVETNCVIACAHNACAY